MPYRLFIANKNYSSWLMRPWVLMEAFGIPFEEALTHLRARVGNATSKTSRHRQGALPAS